MASEYFKRCVQWTLCLCTGLAAGTAVARDAAMDPGIPLTEIRTFAEVFERVQQGYVTEVTDKKLLESAIDGMLAALDPHSAYLDPESVKSLQETTSGKFGGLGIEVEIIEGEIHVITPIDDSPAQKGGIKAGDVITHINKRPVKSMNSREIIKEMRGAPGSKVQIRVRRLDLDKPFDKTLARAIIRSESVKSKIIDDRFGYVRISQFHNQTATNLIADVQKMRLKNPDMQALIIDLRNNPGGLLQSAVDVCDAFLDRGDIVSTRGRTDISQEIFSAHPGDILRGKPIMVLINAGSASASEIVAGCLQDHKRARVMGTRSFGKGSVQTIMPLQNDGALKVTTALYYTPNGTSIQASGITPDVWVEQIDINAEDTEQGYRESTLARHLENPASTRAKDPQMKLALEDYQLYQAVNLLKGAGSVH